MLNNKCNLHQQNVVQSERSSLNISINISISVRSHSKCRAATNETSSGKVCPKMGKTSEASTRHKTYGHRCRAPLHPLGKSIGKPPTSNATPLSNAKFMFIFYAARRWSWLGSQRIFMLWPMFILFELYVARCPHSFGAIRVSIGFMIVSLLRFSFWSLINAPLVARRSRCSLKLYLTLAIYKLFFPFRSFHFTNNVRVY